MAPGHQRPLAGKGSATLHTDGSSCAKRDSALVAKAHISPAFSGICLAGADTAGDDIIGWRGALVLTDAVGRGKTYKTQTVPDLYARMTADAADFRSALPLLTDQQTRPRHVDDDAPARRKAGAW